LSRLTKSTFRASTLCSLQIARGEAGIAIRNLFTFN
jgi:hypothetical protein